MIDSPRFLICDCFLAPGICDDSVRLALRARWATGGSASAEMLVGQDHRSAQAAPEDPADHRQQQTD